MKQVVIIINKDVDRACLFFDEMANVLMDGKIHNEILVSCNNINSHNYSYTDVMYLLCTCTVTITVIRRLGGASHERVPRLFTILGISLGHVCRPRKCTLFRVSY